MSRYRNNEVKKTFDGKEVYRTRIHPNIPLSDNDVYVMTETGDRLDTLAYEYYENSSLWWIIAIANPQVTFGSLIIPEGIQLRIPAYPANVLNNYNVINS